MADHEFLRIEQPRETLTLSGRQIDLWLAGAFQSSHFHVADYADYGPLTSAVPERLADRILTGPVTLDERCAHDGDPVAVAGVAFLDVASSMQGDPHRLEVLRCDPAVTHAAASCAARLVAGNLDRRDEAGRDHRKAAGECGGVDARQRPDAGQHLLVELRPPKRTVVFRPCQRRAQRQHVLRNDPWIDCLHPPHGTNQKPGGDQQHHGQRDFDGHEHGADALFPSAARLVPLAQRGESGTPCPQRGKQPEADGRQHGEQRRNEHHAYVHTRLRVERQRRRHQRREERHREHGDQDAERAAHDRQHHALRDQLPDETRPRRTKRHPQRHLAFLRGCPRQQQVRQVRAHEQQQAEAGTREDREHQAEARGHVVAHPEEADARLCVRLRVLAAEALRQHDELGPGPLEGDARFQPSDRVEICIGAVREVLFPQRQQRPHLHAAAGEIKAGWHHADDRPRCAVQTDFLAEDARVGAELRLPQSVADDRGVGVIRRACIEDAAEQGLDSEHRQHVGRHLQDGKTTRLSSADQVQRVAGERAEVLERRAELLEITVVGRGELVHAAPAAACTRPFAQPHERFGIRERQRPQQHEIGDRECGRIGAHPERDHEDRRK